MQQFTLPQGMTFIGGVARFFATHKQRVCWPLPNEAHLTPDGKLIQRPTAPAFFTDHLWSTTDPAYAAGMVTQDHFTDPDCFTLDPSCLPDQARQVWPTLDRKGKQQLCLALINSVDPAEAIANLPRTQAPPAAADVAAEPEIVRCPVPGCGLVVSGEADPGKARAALLVHQRLVHPEWEA